MILDASPGRERQFLFWGAVSGFLAVALGAFGAHLLEDRLPAGRLAVFETGVRWHAVHALALVVAGLAAGRRPGPWAPAAGWLFAVGTVVFSGSLYVLAWTGARGWGALTPVGGAAWLLGWASLAASARRRSMTVVEIEEDAVVTVHRAGAPASAAEREEAVLARR